MSNFNDDLSSVETDVSNLKERMENSKPLKCKNCKKYPCLKGKTVTVENFVNGAYFRGVYGQEKNVVYGYSHIGGFGKFLGKKFKGQWILFEVDGNEETLTFTENIKSLRYLC